MADRRILIPTIGKKVVVNLDNNAPGLQTHIRKYDEYMVVDVGEQQLFVISAHHTLIGIPLNCIVDVKWNVEQKALGPFDGKPED